MTGTELLDRIRPIEHRLDNGLRLLVLPDRAAPVAAIVTHVKAGYFDEPDDVVGVSHVLEHMFFKGTERRGVGEIARETKSAGGYLNAGTIYDHTTYYTVLPADAVDLGLDLQADALIHSTLDAGELRKELTVIIEEVKRKLDNPSALTTETLFETMFDQHPIRRWRMGRPEALARMTRDQVAEYYRGMYRGGNVVLVVSGDVDPDRVVERVETLYAGLPPGEGERPDRTEPDRADPRIREMSGDVAHVYAMLGWPTPGTLDPDTPALDALATVLGQGRSSRLYQGVRERGLVSAIHAYNYTPTEVGVFGVGLECEPGATPRALRATWHELERVRRDGVADGELERVGSLLEARLLRRLETAEGRANLLAEWQAQGDWRLAGEYLDGIRSLTPEALRAAAARHLDPGRITVLAYRPQGTEPLGWEAGDLVSALTREAPELEPAPAQEAAPEAVPEPVARPRRSRPVPPGSSEDGVSFHTLEGGRLVVKRRPHAPLVSLALFRPGGVTHETAAVAGATQLLMRSTLKGTGTRSAERIARESEAMGGSIGAAAGPDLVSWSITVPSARFAAAFDLLADVASDPVFPEEEVARERAMVLAGLDRLRDDMFRYPIRLFLNAAFPGHPYGHAPDDLARSVPDLAASHLRRWHAGQFGEPWLFVVGDVEPDRVWDVVAERWAPPAPATGEPVAPPSWPEGTDRREARRERAQTALALGFPGPAWRDPDRIPMEVLSSAVSGLGNRLFEELRSRRSLAYTVTAQSLSRRLAGAFLGYIATSADQAEEARDALLAELVRLRREPPSEEELERARRYTIGAWQIRSQTNAAQLAELAAACLLGDGVEEVARYPDRVWAVGRDDVLAAAGRWIDEGRVIEGMVRGGD